MHVCVLEGVYACPAEVTHSLEPDCRLKDSLARGVMGGGAGEEVGGPGDTESRRSPDSRLIT